MTVYKVDNVYYNDESIEQYILQNHSFADFIGESLKDPSGNIRGLLNTINRVWNSSKQDDVVNYLNAINYLYVGYVNNIFSKIPSYTVIEGGKNKEEDTGHKANTVTFSDPVVVQSTEENE